MGDNKSLIAKFLDKNLTKDERNTERAIKKSLPPKPKRTFLGQKLDTRRVEEYTKTVRAIEGVARAYEDLEVAVGDLNSVDLKIEKNKHNILAELEESKQKLEDLMENVDLRDIRRRREVIEEEAKIAKLKAEIEEANTIVVEAQAKAQSYISPPQQPKKKTEMERFENDINREELKQKKSVMINERWQEEKEEAKKRGATENELEMIDARWFEFLQQKTK